MAIENQIKEAAIQAIKELYKHDINPDIIQVQLTRKDQNGDFTLVVFPLLKISGKKPEDTGNDIGNFILEKLPDIDSFEVIKGFLNLTLSHDYWISALNAINADTDFGFTPVNQQSPQMMIEYSSPNTNKPLHLGHIRNNLLGYSLSRIAHANGYRVVKTNIVNDRGIHICKSMLAWKKWGNGETPESTGKKGDHLVGDYYVKFSKKWKSQIKNLKVRLREGLKTTSIAKEYNEKYIQRITSKIVLSIKNLALEETIFKEKDIYELIDRVVPSNHKIVNKKIKDFISKWLKKTALLVKAQKMLRKWEAGDKEVVALWEMMNEWVYAGFNETYKALGVDFDKIYYESQTYSTGREMVLAGLEKGIFYKKDDGSVWVDLTDKGLDEKLLLRSDGTSVYMTQDIGTAKLRFDDYQIDKMVYVVGNEQDYHFKVLSLVLDKLGFEWGKDLVHFSYGMVELPEGKMKSREGTVVDADDLMREMVNTARDMSRELGKLEGYTNEEAENVYRIIALGALKYFMLKVDPRKNMTFNPRESIDFNGNTGPFIQYTYARIQSIFRKATEKGIAWSGTAPVKVSLNDKENNLVRTISNFSNVVMEAGNSFSPALIANYVYDLAKEYNQFYHESPILFEENEDLRNVRLSLCMAVGNTIRKAMWLLGVDVPERM